MERLHSYKTLVEWTGNKGNGTAGYTSYERSHVVKVEGKQELHCSSDPAFRGDDSLYNPEELFISSIASCHMLWYLHLCATAGVIVISYSDNATGIMIEENDGSGRFTSVTLTPNVTVQNKEMIAPALRLHETAHKHCFIANSCNFPIHHQPECIAAD